MAKTKLKKNLSERLIKKTGKQKVINPFEIHVNKQKYNVLGRKSKNDRGLPGIAKAKSIKKRKETLLQEYKVKDKVNKFLDRRIGENNSAMTQEDRVMARYAAERIKSHNKKTKFNLADDEVLTHKGKTLSEIEKYDNPGSDDEDEFGGRGGGLGGAFVEAHFGGGIFREKEDGAKTHAAVIDELIAESKKRKAERQHAKEQTLELTDKLDADWHELLPLVNSGKPNDDTIDKPEKGSYDQLMRELKFESRGVPSDKLKSEDELAKEEKEKLEKLEQERLKRMKGIDNETAVRAPKHRSADDLDDGFDITSEIEDTENTTETVIHSKVEQENESEKSESEDDIDSDNNDGPESQVKQLKVVGNETDGNHSGSDDNDDDDDDDDDDLSDLKQDSDDDETVGDVSKNCKKSKGVESCTLQEQSVENNEKQTSDKFLKSLKRKKQQMEEARKELPYTFKIPENYDELETAMSGYTVDQQGVIVERMIKCSHPSLGENNRSKLDELFKFLLQLLNDADGSVVWKLLDRLAPHFYDLTQFSPDNSARSLIEVITEKYEDFKKRPFTFPGVDTLVYLKLAPLLFPSSDVRHKVTTPAFVFIIHMLNTCKVRNRREMSTGLFIVTMLFEYTSLSNKFCPQAVNFLQGVLELANIDITVSVHNFGLRHFLTVKSPVEHQPDEDWNLSFLDLSVEGVAIDDIFKMKALSTAVKLLNICSKQLENISAYKIIFGPILKLLKTLEISKYPVPLRDGINKLITTIRNLSNRKLQFIMLEKKRPKALRLYEPKIEKVVEGKGRRDIPEEKAEQQKLLAKYKREMKGAIREIRRDTSFLAKVKLRNQAKSDEERRNKVKQIYSWGAAQEGEINMLKRRKKE